MKSFCFAALLMFGSQICATPLSYTVRENPYLFSTYFEIQGREEHLGRALKDHWNFRTIYDLFDSNNEFEGQGICRLFALGAWDEEIDVYGKAGEATGSIEGKFFTSAAAKYSFYDGAGGHLADAYLDSNFSGFTLMSPEGRTLGLLKRVFVPDDADSWDVTLFKKDTLDLRMIKIFSAFAVDFQKEFKEDN